MLLTTVLLHVKQTQICVCKMQTVTDSNSGFGMNCDTECKCVFFNSAAAIYRLSTEKLLKKKKMNSLNFLLHVAKFYSKYMRVTKCKVCKGTKA